MKLRKIVKHFDPICTKAEIYLREYDEPVWKGDMLNLQVAADTREDKEVYIKSLKEENAWEELNEVKTAEKFLDYKLDTTGDYEAIGFKHTINSHNVPIYIVQFNLK